MTALTVVGIAAAVYILGWTSAIGWQRTRVHTRPVGDGRTALLIGRAVAGTYHRASLARARAADVRRQLGGRR